MNNPEDFVEFLIDGRVVTAISIEGLMMNEVRITRDFLAHEYDVPASEIVIRYPSWIAFSNFFSS